MRRNSLALTLAWIMLCGCQKPAAEMETAEQNAFAATAEPDLFLVDPATEVQATDVPGAAPAQSAAPRADVYTMLRTHTVVKGDTLYALARCYYDSAQRWKDIYEANRDRLTDPDLLLIGEVLVIP